MQRTGETRLRPSGRWKVGRGVQAAFLSTSRSLVTPDHYARPHWYTMMAVATARIRIGSINALIPSSE